MEKTTKHKSCYIIKYPLLGKEGECKWRSHLSPEVLQIQFLSVLLCSLHYSFNILFPSLISKINKNPIDVTNSVWIKAFHNSNFWLIVLLQMEKKNQKKAWFGENSETKNEQFSWKDWSLKNTKQKKPHGKNKLNRWREKTDHED